MLILELTCAALVAFYAAARRDAIPTLALLAVAGFVGEDSVIRAYGFYFYSPRWHLFLDRVPLLIVLIWPVVIHSAWRLGRALAPAWAVSPRLDTSAAPRFARFRPWAALAGAAIVLADASLIEPIAVHANLWTWTEPGLFAVPLIGIVGWAFFAGAAMLCLETVRLAAVVVVAPLVTHALLVASWWVAFRWLSRPLSPWPFVAAAWLGATILGIDILRRRISLRVPANDLFLRLPGALFFFVLLGIYGRDLPSLCAWSLAFAPPYIALSLR